MAKKQTVRIEAEINRICANCEKATLLCDSETVLCSKYGVVPCTEVCKKFIYDPLKRIPTPSVPIADFDPQDLIL